MNSSKRLNTTIAHLIRKWVKADLSPKEVEKAEFAFSIYDADGSNSIDCFDLGNVLRALNVNPTNATIEKMGGTKKRGEKTMTLEEFLPIFSQVKKDKDQGCYEDFIECLKLYDKQENGTMLLAELTHVLQTLGERLTEQEVEIIARDCMPEEDEDGFIKYDPFVKKLMSAP
uniref:Myosin light chain alkali n=1 Tax=Trichogramma kaykai TaxID=54128 RepID=A0ABD2W0I8_9HYME